MNTIPMRIRARSRALAFKFLSWNMRTPQMKETSTEPLLTSETTEIIESGWFRAVRYEKSAADMKTEMSGMAQLQRNGVVCFRFGYHRMATITAISIIW